MLSKITLSTATQRHPFLPFLRLTVSNRRRRSLDDAAPTSCDRCRPAEPDPNCDGARSPRPINPSNCSVSVVPASRKQTLARLKSPKIAAARPRAFRPAISCLGASRTPVAEIQTDRGWKAPRTGARGAAKPFTQGRAGSPAYMPASLIRTETARVTHAASATQFSRSAASAFSFPAPETNWIKLALNIGQT